MADIILCNHVLEVLTAMNGKETGEFFNIHSTCERLEALKRGGSNGYFQFIKKWIGSKIAKDDHLNYTVVAGGELLA